MYDHFQGKVVTRRVLARQPSCTLFKGAVSEQKSFIHKILNPRMLERLAVMLVLLIFPAYVALSFERSGGGAPPLTIEGLVHNNTVQTPFTVLRGSTSPSAQVLINNSPIVLRDNGSFEETLALHSGINTLTIVARRYGLSTSLQRTIIYNP